MRTRVLAALVAAILTVAGGFITTGQASASPADEYTGTHFGLGNIPVGCEADTFAASDNVCYHQRTAMNGLDSSDVDVLLMVPASPTASRDMRIMKQAVEMWNGGIQYLAPQMGIPWMKNMHFKISTDIEGAAAGEGIKTWPIVDPKIVVIASNPVGGAGIGIDPWASEVAPITGQSKYKPCTGVIGNPFDTDTWKGMPGYDHHDHEPGATVTQRCPNGGGNMCVALTPAIDPLPPKTDVFSLFDLVAHEFGHCLTIGHVGDGAEGPWSKVPTNDIMSYNQDPPGLNKCVSTLDVESIAVTQSQYIDVNGDGVVDAKDKVDANQASWDSTTDHFMAQHPRDHYYASGTGSPMDCPQPDLGLLPGTPTNWQPTPVTTSTNNLTITSPAEGATASDGNFDVTGTVEHASTTKPPTGTSAAVTDASGDSTTPYTDLLSFTTDSSADAVEATVKVASLPPTGTTATSASSYDLLINGRKFDSFVRYPVIDNPPMTFDEAAGAYMADGTSTWNLTDNSVTFRIPKSYLDSIHITAPYFVSTKAEIGFAGTGVVDDEAPDNAKTVGIAGSDSALHLRQVGVAPRAAADTVVFQHPGGNHFDTENSTLGNNAETGIVGLDNDHHFDLNVPTKSDVAFTLDWTDATGASDLDMTIAGNGVNSGTDAASSNKPETYTVKDFQGKLGIDVDPYLIADPVNGVDYTLTAIITPSADTGGTPPPPPPPAPVNEHVNVYVDDAATPIGSTGVDTLNGPADYSVSVTVPAGNHTLRVEWERFGKVVATKNVTVTSGTVHGNSADHPAPGDHGQGQGGSNADVVQLPPVAAVRPSSSH